MNKNRICPLEGLVILDMTRVLAGPYCGMMFADMGARVIKIEVPGKGDDSRSMGPFIKNESCYFMNLNRNKEGITLNMKTEEGKKIFTELLKKADIVLENYRPGTMEKLGFGYEDIKKINNKIIYGAVSGFGHYGPYSQRPGYDIIAQAMGGLMSTTGWPGGDPTRTGTAMGDVLAGLSITIGVLSALYNRMITGVGQKVEVALVDSVVSSLEIINQIYLATGKNPERIGNRYESTYPYDSFKAKDDYLVIACANDKLFGLLCKCMEREDLVNMPDFKTNWDRVQNNAKLRFIIEEFTKKYNVDELVDMLLKVGIPAAPINTIEKVVNDEHIAKAREMFVPITHPIAGKVMVTGNHLKFSDTKIKIDKSSPLLGEHNDIIFKEFLNATDKDIAEWKSSGVI